MEAEERERVPGLLLEAIESLPEPDRRLVLEHLIDSALLERGGEMPQGQAVGQAAIGGSGPWPPHPAEPGSAVPFLTRGSRAWALSEVLALPEAAMRAALHETAANSRASEPTPSILRLLAKGRTRAEVASELAIPERQVRDELERARPLATRLLEALLARLADRGPAAQESTISYLRAPGPAGQQLVPVRFPEETHLRLKEWCASNGFSMAVVIRGLVDRFLEEYDPREA